MDKDYAKLSKHSKEISDLIEGIQELIEKRDVETLKNFEEAQETYSNDFSELKYLENLTEQDIFDQFIAALLYDSSK